MKSNNIVYLSLGLFVGLLIMYFIQYVPSSKERVEVSHAALVQNIERIGNLEVVKYHVRDIIEYKKIRQWLPNAKTAMLVSGDITVGIDLTHLRPEDIAVRKDTLYLQLPSPQITHIAINHSESKIYDMEFGLWESEKIADEAYREAESYLLEQTAKGDYEDKAYENVKSLLIPMLQAMGFKHVVLSFKSPNQFLK